MPKGGMLAPTELADETSEGAVGLYEGMMTGKGRTLLGAGQGWEQTDRARCTRNGGKVGLGRKIDEIGTEVQVRGFVH